MNRCKCGNNCIGEYCFHCKPRKPLKSSCLKSKPLSEEKKRRKQEQTQEMHSFFQDIWKTRPHRSEVSNTPIYGEPLSTYFHHILTRQFYPEASLDPENIIILTQEEHANVHKSMYKYDEINERRMLLILKYGLK